MTVTTDNSFDNNQIPIAVFNNVNSKGKHLQPQSNVVNPGYSNFLLAEETLTINPTNPAQLAASVAIGLPENPQPSQAFISNDGGNMWKYVDPLIVVNGPVPTVVGDLTYDFPGDEQIIFDAYGNLFFFNLGVFLSPDFSRSSAYCYVTMSADGGQTWTLIDFLKGINPKTYGLDYPQVASGPGPDGSQATWLVLKQDVSSDEIAGVRASLPLITAAYQTSGLGQLVSKTYQEVEGTTNGGYGNISVGPDGGVLLSGSPVNNTDRALPFGNNSIWYSYNKGGIKGQFNGIHTIANSNAENFDFFSYYLPQAQRGAFIWPRTAIDKYGRWYLVYVDQPSTHAVQSNANIYLIYSDDHGKNWSSPVRINNDIHNPSFHIAPSLSVDPISNDLAIAWIDSREDQMDTSTRVWGTVIKRNSLKKISKQ